MELLKLSHRMLEYILVLVLTVLCTAKSTGDLKHDELTFLKEPEDTLLRDTPTWIHCQARGSTQPVVRWLKDGVPISGGLSVLGNGTLVLRVHRWTEECTSVL
jgi:hypothetical protein